ncbi:MAG: hypothetical protein DRH24_02350 [Deltaproteobacteria bacterium]|nr:MAG: hypothetical protein DRH24_02350 [Deltaproteobacteria bacterium]
MRITRFLPVISLLFYCLSGTGFTEQNRVINGSHAAVQTEEGNAAQKTVQMTDINDIRPPVKVGIDPDIFYYFVYAFCAVIMLGLLIAAFFYLKRRKKKEKISLFVSPDEAAFKLLDELNGYTASNGREFYFKLSAGLRKYILGRFGIDALEMTSEELLPRVFELKLDTDLKKEIKNFLYSSDTVKFAGKPAKQEKMESDLKFAKDFVLKTTQTTT